MEWRTKDTKREEEGEKEGEKEEEEEGEKEEEKEEWSKNYGIQNMNVKKYIRTSLCCYENTIWYISIIHWWHK